MSEWLGFYSTDGAIYYVTSYSFNDLYIIIDVNGEKGPNTYGRDVFSFYKSGYNKEFRANDNCSERLLENNFTMDY